MNFRDYLLLVGVLVLASCQDVKRPKAPTNLIDKDTMVQIFSESYLMNAARSVANRDIINKGIKLDSIIYAKYNIDSLQFAQSNAHYSSDLAGYKKIFIEVQQNLEQEKILRDTLYAKYRKSQEAIKLQDSIDKVQLDSLRVVYPKITQDSLKKHLDLLHLLQNESDYKKMESGIDVAPVDSDQDSLL